MDKANKVIFGIGQEGKKILRYIDASEIFCIVDNDKTLWGTSYQDIPIVSLNVLEDKKEEVEIIVSSTKYEKEISQQLAERGFHYINSAKYYINEGFKGRTGKRIIFLNTHVLTNIGDHAIAIATYYFFRRFFPEYEVIEMPAPFCKSDLDYIREYIHDDDILTIAGGGYLGSLWMDCGENNVRAIIECFPNNKIVIMPQTMYFEPSEDGKSKMLDTKQIYASHDNLSICMRDKDSYNLGKAIFPPKIKLFFIPDMAMLMDRSYEIYSREGCVFCFRDDRESVVPSEEKSRLEKYIEKKEIEITYFSMYTQISVDPEQRMEAVNEKIEVFQKSRLVITDRLHCMLLCAISGTPCIAFDNLSKKVSGSYEWIQHLEYIKLADESSNVLGTVDKLLQYGGGLYNNFAFLNKYDELFKIIASAE